MTRPPPTRPASGLHDACEAGDVDLVAQMIAPKSEAKPEGENEGENEDEEGKDFDPVSPNLRQDCPRWRV